MRILIDALTGRPAGTSVDDAVLASLYAAPGGPWLRVNMVSSVDGAATGGDGRSGSINNAVDKRVFDVLRGQADAIVVGAGTARAEGYGPAAVPIVLVTKQGRVPERLRSAPPGMVLLATCATAPGLADSRSVLGEEHVIVLRDDEVELAALRGALAQRGLTNLLSEGGPRLLAGLLGAGAVDELCATVVPHLVGGDGPRIVAGPPLGVPLDLQLLLEESGTLLARWFLRR